MLSSPTCEGKGFQVAKKSPLIFWEQRFGM